MKGTDDLESYVLRLGLPYERINPEMWKIQIEENEHLFVSMAGPVVVFRMKIMELPPADREEFFQTLLGLNTTALVHGAFGLEGQSVVVSAALGLENLDFSEVQSVVDDISLSVRKLYPQLSKFRQA